MSRQTSKRRSKNPNSPRSKRGLKRYWLIALPAIILNAVVTLDHVIAKSNEDAFNARIKVIALEAMEASNVQDDQALSETLRAHWVTTNEDGNLEGRISAIDELVSPTSTVPITKLDVTLMKKGEKIRQATTDNDGRFVLKDVNPGVYTLLAAGQNGFLAYGVQVLEKNKKPEFPVLKNTKVDQQKRQQDYYVSHLNVPQESVVVESLQIDAAAVPPAFTALQRITSGLSSTTGMGIGLDQDDVKAIGQASKIGSGFTHPLADDGSFEGRIQPITTTDGKAAKLSRMNIFLIQDDYQAAQVSVKENGEFKIEDVDPGVYSIIAAGKDGFAALAVELVKSPDAQSSTSGKTNVHYVSSHAGKKAVPLGIAIVTDPQDIKFIFEEVERIEDERRRGLLAFQDGGNPFPAQSGFPQSGFAPSSGFAPGGFPGGPSFPTSGFAPTAPVATGGVPVSAGPAFTGSGGRLLGIAGLTVGITAIATDGDSVVDPGPASPSVPVF